MIASALARYIIYENLYKEKISCYFCRPCRTQQEIFAGISFFMKFKKSINSIEDSIVGFCGRKQFCRTQWVISTGFFLDFWNYTK